MQPYNKGAESMKNYIVNFLLKKFPSVKWSIIIPYVKEQSIKFFIEVLIWLVAFIPVLVMYISNYVNVIVYVLVYISIVLALYSTLELYKDCYDKELKKQRFDGYNF